MLATAHRLRRRDEFTATVRAGRRAGRGTVVTHLRQAESERPARAGFVVSRSVGGAVVRNRVRRRLRHLVRQRLDELPAGSDLVVRALPASARASYARLRDDLATALRAVRRNGERT